MLGPGGRTLQGIADAAGVAAHVCADGSRVSFFGEPTACERAAAGVDAIVRPAVTLRLADALGHLIADGIAGSHSDLLKIVMPRLKMIARRHGVVERVTGGTDADAALYLSGPAPAAEAAAAALLAEFAAPSVFVRIRERWAHLLSFGAYASVDKIRGRLLGAEGLALISSERESGVVCALAEDGVAVFGPRAAAEAMLARIDALLQVCIRVFGYAFACSVMHSRIRLCIHVFGAPCAFLWERAARAGARAHGGMCARLNAQAAA